jgi:hydrogenase maturation protease
MKTILFAIGNNARQDDGLGWAFGEALERGGLFNGEVHYRYQLQVEDADLVAGAEQVFFVDAFKRELPGGIQWEMVEPSANFEFTTHALSPQAVMFLCEQLYGKRPGAHCLLLGGEAWELGLGLSKAGERNLAAAVAFFEEVALKAYPGSANKNAATHSY